MSINSWLAALTLALTAGAASAQSDLPEDVRRSYVAYTQAMEAQDYERALQAAHEAWQTAQATGYDPAVTVTLADNYAQLADALRQFDRAHSAYRSVAEAQQALGDPPGIVGQTWRLAAMAALSAGDTRQAIRLADTAGDLLQNASDVEPGLRANELFLSRAIQAHALWRNGSTQDAARRARQAHDALQGHDLTSEGHFALLAFYRGAAAAVQSDDENAAYWLSAAHTWMVREGSHPEMRHGLSLWADYARGRLGSSQRMQLLQRLTAESLIEPVDDGEPDALLGTETEADGESEYAIDPANHDAYPLRRVPPQYPPEAAMAGAEGIAVLSYSVDERGRVVDPEILFSIPFSNFGDAAIEAVSAWRYEPKRVDGQPVRREGVVTTFDFVLEN